MFAIESKFTEPYYYKHKHGGIKEKYLAADIWKDIPETHKLAKRICPNGNLFQHFHAAQLIKHILGLKKHHTAKKGFRLLYLWYDVLGDDGAKHHAEIEQFAEVVKKDEVDFLHLTYQEFISKLAEKYRVGNEEYIDYLTERYLQSLFSIRN